MEYEHENVTDRLDAGFGRLLDSMGVNIDDLTWSEDSFDMLFEIDTPSHPTDKESNQFIFDQFELAIASVVREFGHEMQESAKAFMERAARGEKAILTFQDHSSLFPWLPWTEDRRLIFEGSRQWGAMQEGFDLSKPLAGQHREDLSVRLGVLNIVPFEKGKIDLRAQRLRPRGRRRSARDRYILSHPEPQLGTTIATFELISLGFEPGSIFPTPRVRRKILSSAMAVLALGFVSDRVSGIIKDQEFARRVEAKVEGQSAVKYCGARFSYDDLRNNTERSFDYNEKGISAQERFCRIGLEQAAMKLALNTDLAVDGKLGEKTLAHEEQYGLEKHVPGTNKNQFFRGKLAKEFQPPSDK